MAKHERFRILVRGAGEMATGVALALRAAGFRVVMTETEEPRAIRRAVAFSEAVYEGRWKVEGVEAVRAEDVEAIKRLWRKGQIPVVVDPKAEIRRALRPHVLVDATLRKRRHDTRRSDAPLVIGLGPGFRAGRNCHAAVETNRGHDLGRILWKGAPASDTGEPAPVKGVTFARVLRAPCGGAFEELLKIGDRVRKGQAVARVDGQAVRAGTPGVLRGILRSGVRVRKDEKAGDVDPTGERRRCFTVSDKARALGGATLLAVIISSQRSVASSQ